MVIAYAPFTSDGRLVYTPALFHDIREVQLGGRFASPGSRWRRSLHLAKDDSGIEAKVQLEWRLPFRQPHGYDTDAELIEAMWAEYLRTTTVALEWQLANRYRNGTERRNRRVAEGSAWARVDVATPQARTAVRRFEIPEQYQSPLIIVAEVVMRYCALQPPLRVQYEPRG